MQLMMEVLLVTASSVKSVAAKFSSETRVSNIGASSSLVDLLGNLAFWARLLEPYLRAQFPTLIYHTDSGFRWTSKATGERAWSVGVRIHYLGDMVAR